MTIGPARVVRRIAAGGGRQRYARELAAVLVVIPLLYYAVNRARFA